MWKHTPNAVASNDKKCRYDCRCDTSGEMKPSVDLAPTFWKRDRPDPDRLVELTLEEVDVGVPRVAVVGVLWDQLEVTDAHLVETGKEKKSLR